MKQLIEWVLVTIALFIGATMSGILFGDFQWHFVLGASVGTGLNMLMVSKSKVKE